MIEIGALVRVMNAIHSDSILVGTVKERLSTLGGPVWLRIQPAFGQYKWVNAQDCDVLQQSDL